jgi:hypothetical protein
MADIDEQATDKIGMAGGAIRAADNFVRDTGEVAQYAGYAVAAWLDSVAMDPTSIQNWLNRFSDKINTLTFARDGLLREAGTAAQIPLGEFSPSLQIRAKIADRMGGSDGGLARVLDSILQPLTDIHEAFRQALAAHLHTDFDSAEEFGKVGP